MFGELVVNLNRMRPRLGMPIREWDGLEDKRLRFSSVFGAHPIPSHWVAECIHEEIAGMRGAPCLGLRFLRRQARPGYGAVRSGGVRDVH